MSTLRTRSDYEAAFESLKANGWFPADADVNNLNWNELRSEVADAYDSIEEGKLPPYKGSKVAAEESGSGEGSPDPVEDSSSGDGAGDLDDQGSGSGGGENPADEAETPQNKEEYPKFYEDVDGGRYAFVNPRGTLNIGGQSKSKRAWYTDRKAMEGLIAGNFTGIKKIK